MVFEIITQLSIGLLISYILLFILSLYLKDNSIADIFWGLGFIQLTIHTLIISNTFTNTANIIFSSLILLWGLRLSSHIFKKKLKTKKEDPRYQEFRKQWKFFYIRSFFQVYILQGFLMLIIAIPIILFNSSKQNLSEFLLSGIIIALFGLIYESIADKQLSNFISNIKNKGNIIKTGLWKYSRHPNYFGESMYWLGISIISLPISTIAILSWATITLLLRFVSGVPLTEKSMQKKPGFQEYKRTTPVLLPNFFKK